MPLYKGGVQGGENRIATLCGVNTPLRCASFEFMFIDFYRSIVIVKNENGRITMTLAHCILLSIVNLRGVVCISSNVKTKVIYGTVFAKSIIPFKE
jgi:hypothetical protein